MVTETTIVEASGLGQQFQSNIDANPSYRHEPLKPDGVLDEYKSFDVTPVIGREFPDAQLVDWLNAPNADALIRDLAITSMYLTHVRHKFNLDTKRFLVSQRGVVFFRKQDSLTNDLQKVLAQKLGELTGKPSTSKLHIHPIINSGRTLGGNDDEISVISSEQRKTIYKNFRSDASEKRQSSKPEWHSDITFEPIPSDYALLRLTKLPKVGGGKSTSLPCPGISRK